VKARHLLVATKNPNKVAELRPLLAPALASLALDLRPLGPDDSTPAEDRPTFAGNAILKAVSAANRSGEIALSEDSGLEVDTLGGAPGVLSARYSGGGSAENNSLLLGELAGVPEGRREARFRTAVAVKAPGGPVFVAEGVTEGHITDRPRGSGGFGYDPVFLSRDLGRTFAEVSQDEKNRVSHRSRALRAIRGYLFEVVGDEDFDSPRGSLPGHDACVRIQLRVKCPPGLIAHQLGVGRLCRELALSLAEAGVAVDVPLAAAAGLLHDIGRTATIIRGAVGGGEPPEGVVDHAWLSARWLDRKGCDSRLGRAVLVHGLDSLFSPVWRPSTREEQVLMLCDKLVERAYVGLGPRLAGLAARYPAAGELIAASEEPLRHLERDLAQACRVTVAEMERRLAATLAVEILPRDSR